MLSKLLIYDSRIYSKYPNTLDTQRICCNHPKKKKEKEFAVITLKFEQDGFTEDQCTQKKQPEL